MSVLEIISVVLLLAIAILCTQGILIYSIWRIVKNYIQYDKAARAYYHSLDRRYRDSIGDNVRVSELSRLEHNMNKCTDPWGKE